MIIFMFIIGDFLAQSGLNEVLRPSVRPFVCSFTILYSLSMYPSSSGEFYYFMRKKYICIYLGKSAR